MPAMTMDQFLKHSSRGSGSRGTFLKDWKETPGRSITVWLHMKVGIMALWRHPWTRVVPREKDGVKSREVWMDRLLCFESEEVLKNQHFRDRTTGVRDLPPQVCPHCKMIEHVRQQVVLGRMKLTDPLFKFEGTDPSKTKIFHAGGIWKGFGQKSLTAEDKAAMAAVPPQFGGPIFSRDAFKQDSTAKLEYAFCIVDNDDAEKGVQIAVESSMLGQEVQTMIAQAIKQEDDGTGRGVGERLGNPLVTPYAIRFEHTKADEKNPFGAYQAIRMPKIRIRPAIDKLIRETDPPEGFAKLAEPFNLRTHKALLERHCLVKGMPWDEFFGPALELEAKGKLNAPPAEQSQEPEPREERTPDVDTKAETPADDGLFECDNKETTGCKGVMKGTDPACPECGKRYDVVAAPEPPKPALPKRSQAQAAPPKAPTTPESSGDNDGDDVPF